MKVLVTGAGGFVGKYLVDNLIKNKCDVVAIGVNNGEYINSCGIRSHVINILDYTVLEETFKIEKPDAVIHLAAISNVPVSWDNPAITIDVNVKGAINVFLALANTNPNGIMLNIGSSDEYGLTAKKGIPLTEDMLCQPQNPYSISKYCTEQMLLQLSKKYGTKVISTRSFNHFGPGQATGFAIPDFASQIVKIERGRQEPIIKVGELSASRDFTYVEDIVEAYMALIMNDVESGVYNICSSKGRKIEDILFDLLKLSDVNIKVEIDSRKLRPVEVPMFIGDYNKIEKATGWQPKCDYWDSIKKVMNYYRCRDENLH